MRDREKLTPYTTLSAGLIVVVVVVIQVVVGITVVVIVVVVVVPISFKIFFVSGCS